MTGSPFKYFPQKPSALSGYLKRKLNTSKHILISIGNFVMGCGVHIDF